MSKKKKPDNLIRLVRDLVVGTISGVISGLYGLSLNNKRA